MVPPIQELTHLLRGIGRDLEKLIVPTRLHHAAPNLSVNYR